MMAAFWSYMHILKREADVPPDVFSLIERGYVEVTCPVLWRFCRVSISIKLEEIEFAFRTYEE